MGNSKSHIVVCLCNFMLLLLLFVVVTFFLKLYIYFVLLQYCVANTLFMTNHIHVAMMWIQIVSKEKSKTKAKTTWSLQWICFYHIDTCRYWSPCPNPKPKQSYFNLHTWILKQKKVQTFVSSLNRFVDYEGDNLCVAFLD